ncbi:cobyrinic acid a,c-diamide synthase [Rhodobacteraceae bacterium HIMB11]|nr:cobyrinic acid a,c-diamide synthase [Rhodobacteraceae bacterium HIMB11]
MTKSRGFLISAPSSGTGKTTVTLGLLRAFRDRGNAVQPYKSGPDYIDPAFHRFASGRASYNLDTWAMGAGVLQGVIETSTGADIVIAEGSMGLFDGVLSQGAKGFGSSAETAKYFGWPVIIVIDVSGQAQSAAAAALGFKLFDPSLPIAGVILNRVASPRHERYVRQGMEDAGLKVFGSLPRRGDLALPERHLGLIQAVEHPDLETAIADYANFVSAHLDLDAIEEAAAETTMPAATAQLIDPPAQRIALAQDEAFSFTYPHILKGWREKGAEVLPFSPLANQAPDPTADLVWLPGGYPELHGGKIAGADAFLNGLRTHGETKPVHGECGGYMVLGETLIDKDGTHHKMAGLLGLVTSFEKRKFHLGYRQVSVTENILNFAAGDRLRGHEFHYSRIIEQPDQPLFEVADADGTPVPETGSRRVHVSGTFFHLIAKERG